MMPRDFLFGLVRVPMWDYYWGLTAAQVELLTIDQPIVVYKADKTKDKPWKDGYVDSEYANRQYQKWLEKKRQREKAGNDFNINDAIANAKRLDMNAFLNTGEKKEL
jgi:hypothetical protein